MLKLTSLLLFAFLLAGQEATPLRDLIGKWNSLSDRLYQIPTEHQTESCRKLIDGIDGEVDELNFYIHELNAKSEVNYKEADLIDWLQEVIAKGQEALVTCRSSSL